MASKSKLAIRLALHGCTNRPFYHIVVIQKHKARNARVIEQLGSYDPMPNTHGEKLVGVNFDRLTYHYSQGALVSEPVEKLLGLCGYFPIHPMTHIEAKRNRQQSEQAAQAATTAESATEEAAAVS